MVRCFVFVLCVCVLGCSFGWVLGNVGDVGSERDLGLLYIIVAYLLTAACGTCCLGQHGCRRARRPTRAFLPLVALEALEDGVE